MVTFSRLSILAFAILILSQPARSQSILKDAKEIEALCTEYPTQLSDQKTLLRLRLVGLIRPYLPVPDTASAGSMLRAMSCSTILTPADSLLLTNGSRTAPLVSLDVMPENKSSAAPLHSGSTSFAMEGAIVNGLATFMAERFEEELTAYAIDRLLETVDTTKSNRLARFMPKTSVLAQQLAGKPYYAYSIEFFHTAVRQDIRDLPTTLAKPGVLPGTIGSDVLPVYQLWTAMMTGDSMDVVFDRVADELEKTKRHTDLAKALRHASVMVDAFTHADGTYDLGIPDTLLAQNERIRRIYGVLVNARLKESMAWKEPLSLAQLQADLSRHHDLIRLIRSTDPSMRSDLEMSAKLTTALLLEFGGVRSTVLAVSHAYAQFVLASQEAKPGDVLQHLVVAFGDSLGLSPKDMNALMLLGGLANVEKPEDMTAFLSANALPIGGSRVKRQSANNLSLNGYVGGFGGVEWMDGVAAPVVGLSSPIGLSWSWSWTSKKATRRSISAFVSAFDLSTLVSARLDGDSTYYSALRFEQFISLGGGLFYNVQNSPFTFGLYGSYVPNLRTIDLDGTTAGIQKTNRSVGRIGVSVFVDIPMFTIRNRQD